MNKFSHIKTWIFDLDDTLYAPSEFSSYFIKHLRSTAAKHLGITLDECNKYCKELVTKHGGVPFTGLHRESGIDMNSFIKEGFDIDLSLLKSCAKTKAILESIKGRKVVFTNSPSCHAGKVLTTLDYKHIFDDIFDVTMFNFDSKPNIGPYKHVLNSLNVEGSTCIMIEDSLKNLKTAKEFGMTTVYVHGNEEDIDGVADYSYDTLLEFLNDVNRAKDKALS